MMYLQYNCTKAKHSITLGSVLLRNSKKNRLYKYTMHYRIQYQGPGMRISFK